MMQDLQLLAQLQSTEAIWPVTDYAACQPRRLSDSKFGEWAFAIYRIIDCRPKASLKPKTVYQFMFYKSAKLLL